MDNIQVHELSQNPHEAWKSLKASGWKNDSYTPMPLDTAIKDDFVRFVCVSDTHNHLDKCSVPQGDVFLYAGDFTYSGEKHEIEQFFAQIAELPHKTKIVIAGNHELSFDHPKNPGEKVKKLLEKALPEFEKSGIRDPRELIRDCIYLEDEEVEVLGYKIYGTPWQPEHGGWAFGLPRGEKLLEKWNQIPADTDILLCHCPPVGHGDLSSTHHTNANKHQGCVELLNSIELRIKPKYVVFGHIHEGFGCTTNGETVFINASSCDMSKKPGNPAIIFDLPLKNGFSKNY